MSHRDIVLDLLMNGVKACDPYRLVREATGFDGKCVLVKSDRICFSGELYVVGFGKASARMALAIEDLAGDLISDGVVVTKYGYGEKLRRIRVVEAGHPVPDMNSLKGAMEVTGILEKASRDDLVLVLVSGGGSSLLVYPEDGIGLDDKVLLNRLLIECGASIHEVNVVRKHVSRVKGGKLTRYTSASMVSLIISDVVGNDLASIASGPTTADPTTFHDAYNILVRYGLWSRVPYSIRSFIEKGLRGEVEETVKELRGNVYNYVIGDVSIALEAMYKEAMEHGYKPYILSSTVEGEAREVAKALGSIVQEIYYYNRPFKKPCILLAGGELTVTLPEEHGLGGPNQEFVLAITRKISGLKGVVVAALDTDGTDGPTNAAGGVVDYTSYDKLLEKGYRLEEALARHDSYNVLKSIDSLIITGPTKTNVNSIYVILIE